MKGQKAYVKQCMPKRMKIDVETANKDRKQSIIPWITSVTRPSKKLTKKEGFCKYNTIDTIYPPHQKVV